MLTEKQRLRQQQWRKTDVHKRYLEENRERLNVAHREKRASKPLVYKAIKDKYRKTEKYKLANRAYSKRPDVILKTKEKNHRRRLAGVGAVLPKRTFQKLYEENIKKYGQLTCVLCFCPCSFESSSIEHLLPVSRGGTNIFENLAVAHLKCNLMKKEKTLEEWNGYVTKLSLKEILL